MKPESKILKGEKFLRRDNPWPEFGYGEIAPFYLALDGNGTAGREIITNLITTYNIETMVEIGCFLCGSSIDWLKASEKLTLIGVDRWEGNWAAYIEMMAIDPVRSRSVWHLKETELKQIVFNLRRFGNYAVALNNVRLYKERFIPIRRSSPEVFEYLRSRDIVPQLIYIDADKNRIDLDEAYRVFPSAILCGDDWLWPDQSGTFVMQENVKQFALEHGFTVENRKQSWLLIPPNGFAPFSSST
jgi:hypothetical protein